MNAERQIWFDEHKKYFNTRDLDTIKSTLECVDDYTFALIQTANYKNPKTTLILAIFLGVFGVDDFYLGNYIFGFIKLMTSGGLFIWNIIDIFTAKMRTIRQNTQEWNTALGVSNNTPHSPQADMSQIKEFVKSSEFKSTAKSIGKSLKAIDDNMYANIGG